MNARKFFALLATLVLLHGTASTATAQTAQSDTQIVSVTLTGGASVCGIQLHQSTGTFGLWAFDVNLGTYRNTSAGSTIEFEYSAWAPSNAGCNVTVWFDGLSTDMSWIGPEHFGAEVSVGDGPWATVSAERFTSTGVGAGANGANVGYDFRYTLNSVPAVDPGKYFGNVNVYISATV